MSLGKIVKEEIQVKDAIHVATLTAKAGQTLYRGDWVKLNKDNVAVECEPENALGIVDPFFADYSIEPDEWFTIVVKPETVTKMRHEWELVHPTEPDDPDYLVHFAKNLGVSHEDLIQAAHDWIDHKEHWTQGCKFEGDSTGPEFWAAFEKLTGKVGHGNFLNCSDTGYYDY